LTFLAAVISIAGVLGSVTIVMMILLMSVMCTLRYNKRYDVTIVCQCTLCIQSM
jgi:hypothetical protein